MKMLKTAKRLLAGTLVLAAIAGGAWFWKWKASSLSVQKAATQMNLNFDSYKRREHHILGQLDKSSDDFFANINLK